jgi:5S rRNA maturation endonuclease (ribonuclease M5)
LPVQKIIIIYDFDLAGVTGANKLKRYPDKFLLFVSTKRMTINGKLKLLIKISQTSVDRTKKRLARDQN